MLPVVLEDVSELDGGPVEITLFDQTQGVLVMLFGALFGRLAASKTKREAEGEDDAKDGGREHGSLSGKLFVN
jgi:hypothetical protein